MLHLAISTCPNDTFVFHAILENRIDLGGLELSIDLLDISQLNAGLMEGQFDVAKASFHAAALLSDQTVVLPSGSALGFGVGPLLLAANPDSVPDRPVSGDSSAKPSLTLCPGPWTTATMLFQLFYAEARQQGITSVEHRLFSDIMPLLQQGQADFGVCIHEGRFTWQQEGLYCVEDLGTRWEQATQCPLPLGGILARRELGDDLIEQVQQVVRRSIEYGQANRAETLPTMRKYAQELNDDVLFQHVDLYVNDWTVDLGDQGRRALTELSDRSNACGLVSQSASPIEIWGQAPLGSGSVE